MGIWVFLRNISFTFFVCSNTEEMKAISDIFFSRDVVVDVAIKHLKCG